MALNLGIRYDLYTRLTELNNLAASFRLGPGQSFVDDITTGAGQIKNDSVPCLGNPLATIAGVCGPEGFAPVKSLGAGDHNNFGPRLDSPGICSVMARRRCGEGSEFPIKVRSTGPTLIPAGTRPFILNSAINSLVADVNHVVYGPVEGGTRTFLGSAPPAQHAGSGVQATGNISGWDPANPNIAALTSIIFPEASLIRR